jgi:hypothetical protein
MSCPLRFAPSIAHQRRQLPFPAFAIVASVAAKKSAYTFQPKAKRMYFISITVSLC